LERYFRFLIKFPNRVETEGVIEEFHKVICAGNHAWRETSYKILRAGYYWPKLFTEKSVILFIRGEPNYILQVH
jgi:hypothetical protein